MLADLHMHSTVSDGWQDPDEVAHLAADHGIRVMALTDHDSFYGVLRARAAAHRRGLGYVTGVEVSTYRPCRFATSWATAWIASTPSCWRCCAATSTSCGPRPGPGSRSCGKRGLRQSWGWTRSS